MDAGPVYRAACDELGLTYLSPREPVDAFLAVVSGSRRVISEALHGAIVAEAYNVPWAPVITTHHVMHLKWRDFCDTVGVAYRPYEIHLNVAFDGRPRLANRLKHAAYRLGLGKQRYKYLPLARAGGDEAHRIADRLRPILDGDGFSIGDPAVRNRSVERLDAAIDRFRRSYVGISAGRP
jgi:succinoglycan biosynthesis protein ExoV